MHLFPNFPFSSDNTDYSNLIVKWLFVNFLLSNFNFLNYILQFEGIYEISYNKEKKEEIWLSPMTKAPTPAEIKSTYL